jgi:hypothetical protein
MAEWQWGAVVMWSGGQNFAHGLSKPQRDWQTIRKDARVEIYFRQSHHVA